MKITTKMSGLAFAAAVGALFAGSAMAQERVLKITNWAEYLAEDTIANFEAEYGIKVIYDTYDSAESIDAKLLAGSSGYDIVIHAAGDAARLIKAGIVAPLDLSKLDNLKHMDPAIMTQLASDWDPGNMHIIPFMWGTHGVTYNRALVLETYPDAPIGSMDLIFDPVHMAKIAKCGVSFLDSPGDIIPMALAHLGLVRIPSIRLTMKPLARCWPKSARISKLLTTMPTSACHKKNSVSPQLGVQMDCWRCQVRKKPTPVLCLISIFRQDKAKHSCGLMVG